jgi:hypothetical protein
MNRKHIPSPELYKRYYINQAQQIGGGEYFAGRLFQKRNGQRGRGIASIFGSLIKRALPFLSTATKNIGKAALKTGVNVVSDTMAGQRFQDSLQNRLKETGGELKRQAVSKLSNVMTSQTGSGRKRRKTKQAKGPEQKKRKQQKKRGKNKSKPIKRKNTGTAVKSRKTTKPITYQDIFG